MRVLWVLLVLVAGVAQAQKVVKCVNADGFVTYQQTDCEADQAREVLEVEAQPRISSERRHVRVYNPQTRQHFNQWMDVQTTDGPTYTTRERQFVRNPQTGQEERVWVDVEHPIPQAPPPVYVPPPPRAPPMAPRYNPERSYTPEPNYYRPSDGERRRNSAYERNRCVLLTGKPDC